MDSGNRRKRLKGAFGRKWTHNEQLMVRPCGVVIGRATFYNAESVSAVKVSEILSRHRRTTDKMVKGIHSECIPGAPPGLGTGHFVLR